MGEEPQPRETDGGWRLTDVGEQLAAAGNRQGRRRVRQPRPNLQRLKAQALLVLQRPRDQELSEIADAGYLPEQRLVPLCELGMQSAEHGDEAVDVKVIRGHVLKPCDGTEIEGTCNAGSNRTKAPKKHLFRVAGPHRQGKPVLRLVLDPGRTQVNKALHTCTSWHAYAAMFGSSQYTRIPHSADLSTYNRQTVTFVRPSLSRVLSAKTSSLHATVQGVQALCTGSLRDAGTVSANVLLGPGGG